MWVHGDPNHPRSDGLFDAATNLTITIAAHDLDPTTLTLEPIADPAARLLGPEPEEAPDQPA